MTDLEKIKLYDSGFHNYMFRAAHTYTMEGVMLTVHSMNGDNFAALSAEYESFDCSYEWCITYDMENSIVHFAIPAEFRGYKIVSLGTLPECAAKKVYLEKKYLGDELCVVLDFSKSDLSNIVYLGRYFYTLGKSKIILPEGKGMLKPVSVDKAFCNSNIVNINDVIKHIDFSIALSARETFAYSGYTDIDFRGCNFGNIKTAEQMFSNCTKLESVQFDNGTFKSLRHTKRMFYRCYELKEFNLGCITGGTVDDLCDMFSYCIRLRGVKVPNGWSDVVSKNTLAISCMFYCCYNVMDIVLDEFLSILGEFSTDEFILYGCNNLGVSNLVIHSNDSKSIEMILAHMNKDVYDIRGTRVIGYDGSVKAISIINEDTLQDVHRVFDIMGDMKEAAIILDKEQYEQNFQVIEGYQNTYGVEVIAGDTETISVTMMKIRLFGDGKVNRGIIFVDNGVEHG